MRTRRKRNQVPASLAHIQGFDIKAVLRRRGVYLRQRTNLQLKDAARPLVEALVKNHLTKKQTRVGNLKAPRNYISFDDSVVSQYAEKQIANVTTIEEHFERAVKNFLLNSVLQKALANLDATIEAHKTEKAQHKALEIYKDKQVFNEEDQVDLENQATIDLEPLLQNMGVIAGQDANKLIGVQTPYLPSEALRKQVMNNVQKFTKSMLETDQEHLTSLIVDGIDNGDSIQQIRKGITDDFGDYSTMQAQRITRTEVLRSATQSTLDAFKQSGIVSGKQWVTAGAIDECADYEGEVESLDANFYDAITDFADGDPPLHPNCRCVLIPVLEDVVTEGLSDSEKKAYRDRIKELESQIDKRTKAFRQFKKQSIAKQADDKAYIKALEKYVGDDESA